MKDNQPVLDNITEVTCYQYNVTDIGTYTISVSSIDYFGVMVGDPATTTAHIRPPDIRVIPSFNCDSNIISIIIQRDDADELPIRHCNLTFNSVSYDCSVNRVVSFDVTPGEYNYSVMMSNDVGSSVYGTTVIVDLSPTVSSCIVDPTTTNPPCPTVTPTTCPPSSECKLRLWALIVMIALGVLLLSAVVFYIWKLCWRHCCCCRKCFCEDEDCCCQSCCWDSPFWTYFFCDCFKKDKNKRIASTNERTKSPDEEKETVAL